MSVLSCFILAYCFFSFFSFVFCLSVCYMSWLTYGVINDEWIPQPNGSSIYLPDINLNPYPNSNHNQNSNSLPYFTRCTIRIPHFTGRGFCIMERRRWKCDVNSSKTHQQVQWQTDITIFDGRRLAVFSVAIIDSSPSEADTAGPSSPRKPIQDGPKSNVKYYR